MHKHFHERNEEPDLGFAFVWPIVATEARR